VPWLWVGAISLTWVATNYVEQCSVMPLTFTLRKFIDDPALISLISSVNVLFNFMVGAVVCYLSDRIWTPIGRRKPFLIIGWLGVALCLFLLPLARHFTFLVMIVVLYQFFQDVAKPVEALYNEVVPVDQRGRASVVRRWLQQGAAIFFSAVLIAQYDEQYLFHIGRWDITIGGDHVIFWLGSIILVSMSAMLFFRVEERRPLHEPETMPVQPVRFLKTFFVNTFGDHQSRMVYMLWMAPFIIGVATRPLMPLFQTEQLGFSKAEIGKMLGIVLPIDVFLFTPLAGFLVDRISRLRLMKWGIFLPMLVNFAFFLYVRYVAHYEITIWTMIGFGIVSGFFMAWMFIAWGPILYDYVPSNRMGTISGGLSIVGGICAFLLQVSGGLWVKGWTTLFGTVGQSEYDYSSCYVLNLLLALVALGMLTFFERQVRQGRVIAYGRLEQQEEKERELEEEAETEETEE
jgi:maltose/moltooligosaccharide transporter